MAWNYFVHHYSENEERDQEKYVPGKGILYPRAGTLGGCTAHNAMITIVPHDSDWKHIADVTEDDSWLPARMRPYFQRVEQCLYRKPDEWPKPKGHGYSGWLQVNTVDFRIGIGDEQIRRMFEQAWWSTLGKFGR